MSDCFVLVYIMLVFDCDTKDKILITKIKEIVQLILSRCAESSNAK